MKGHDYQNGPPEGECEIIVAMSCMGPHLYCCKPAEKHENGQWLCEKHRDHERQRELNRLKSQRLETLFPTP